ncbi:MAG: hypothetical protein IPI46_03915 [Bacteroidetes bacterium]|nr:hypothetical protein [Bacteroidota bacterium]
MTIKQLQDFLQEAQDIQIKLPNGNFIPPHFHITEVGLVQKHFIDCGATIRNEKTASMQIWTANDTDHRLAPSKLLQILHQSQTLLGDDNLSIEVEYQLESIGKFGLEVEGNLLQLIPLYTTCLANDHCGIPTEKMPKPLKDLQVQTAGSCCTPGGGCC